jgi:hypothetical protein
MVLDKLGFNITTLVASLDISGIAWRWRCRIA